MDKKIAILIALILISGFYLRLYHINYPVIGYHNWKETHYLTEARNFAREGFFKYGFFVPSWSYPGLMSNPSGAHSDTFPLTPILAAVLFKIFGIELWIARLTGAISTTLIIPVIYLISKNVFKREDIAITSAILAAILPLTLFYSHNVQLVNPALFLFICSVYFFLKWRKENQNYSLILSSLFFTLSAMTKYDFLPMALLFIFLFPFKKLKEIKKTPIFISLIIFLLFPMWYFYSNEIVAPKYGTEAVASPEKVNYLQILNPSEWKLIEPYFSDSFTLMGVLFAFFGIIIATFSFFKTREFSERFVISLSIASILFFIMLFFKIKGHSYHLYPLALFFIISISYFIIKVADFFKRLNVSGKSIPYINLIVIGIIFLFLIPEMQKSTARQFDTQFYGLDIAGEYIKGKTEWIMHSSHQAYGILWHGDVKGTRGIPTTIEDIEFAEENLNATWIFMYNWDFNKIMENKEVWNYIKNNYELKQFAFLQPSQGTIPIYMLFKKGGTFDENNLNIILMGKPIKYKDYELMNGKVRLNYINL